MSKLLKDLRQILCSYGQEHVLAWWNELDRQGQSELINQVAGLDLALLRRLYEKRDEPLPLPPLESIQPIPVDRLESGDSAARQLGEQALRQGEVAILVVAGGQGSRLGFDRPKGCYPVGPVSGKSLFQIHAEKVVQLERKYSLRRPLRFLVMTSPATHAETCRYFKEQRFFGLQPDQVTFFCQGTMPALDLATGKLLMEERGRLFLSPNGHGGVLEALGQAGLLRELAHGGVRHLYYFQVDNPLTVVADPLFLGHHLRRQAEVSTKVVPKRSPTDRLGNVVLVDGRCSVIEYSDLPERLARKTDRQGRLCFSAGNTAIHIFDLEFLHRVHEKALLPFHLARKKVPYLDERGQRVEPATENALKFEKFIFDILPLAERWTVVETERWLEFEPLKNATGVDSPQTVRQAISELAGHWLEQAGAVVPRNERGEVAVPLEISPLVALGPEDLKGVIEPGTRITEARYFG